MKTNDSGFPYVPDIYEDCEVSIDGRPFKAGKFLGFSSDICSMEYEGGNVQYYACSVIVFRRTAVSREVIKTLALKAGFKLKAQPDGSLDLNPYVYDFAYMLIKHSKRGV